LAVSTSSKARSSGKLWTTVFAVVVLLALRRWVIPRYSRPADEPTVPEVA
jgi:hypothetical protein